MTSLHVAVAIFDDMGRILLVLQGYRERLWSPPGGSVEQFEPIRNAAIREASQETGCRIQLEEYVGAYSAPTRGMLSLVFAASIIEVLPWQPTEEIVSKDFFDLQSLPLPLSQRMRTRIEDAFAGASGVIREDMGS